VVRSDVKGKRLGEGEEFQSQKLKVQKGANRNEGRRERLVARRGRTQAQVSQAMVAQE
jgi:hypothetical protein